MLEIRQERPDDIATIRDVNQRAFGLKSSNGHRAPVTVLDCYNSARMLHRHLNHSEWTLAAIDDVIARGKLDDWKELRDAAKSQTEIRDKILRVATPYLSDPYAQRYHFWNFYVRQKLA